VEEGRGVFDNLIKFITWTIPTNLTEGGVILIASLFGLALPLMPLQILWKSALLLIAVFALYELAMKNGLSIEAARTGAVNMIVFGEIFYLFSSRSLKYSLFKIGFFQTHH